jgi:glycosyltransferase involved in cell wall biosynthesis
MPAESLGSNDPTSGGPRAAPGVPTVSVIIPAYNASDNVGPLLECLMAQDYPASAFEIIVDDDGSTDGALDGVLSRFSRVTFLPQKRAGSYAARNTGAAASQAGVLAFTDADCRPRAGWLREGVAALCSGRADLIAGAVVAEITDRGSVVQCYDACFGIVQEYYSAQFAFGATANLMLTRKTFLASGGFDGRLRSCGDQEFCNRAVRHGYRLAYSGTAEVGHRARTTVAELVEKRIRAPAAAPYHSRTSRISCRGR